MSNKNVQPIKIKISTNVDKEPFDLIYSKIYDPVPNDTTRRILASGYPYFTADLKYDEKLLASKPYSQLLNIFFDKQAFVKNILKDSIAPTNAVVSETVKNENANANIMTMLKLIFPISYPAKNNINTSYKKYLLKQGPSITFDISDVKTMFYSESIVSSGKHEYSYIQTNRGVCTVSEVLWLNDVLNNKLYRELIDQLIEYNEWSKKQTTVILEDIKKTTDQLQNGLMSKDTSSGTGTGELYIDEAAQNDLISQKLIYNPNDIKADMINVIKEHITITPDTKDVNPNDITEKNRTRFYEELGYMLEYFIGKYLKDKDSPITQLSNLKSVFNFIYENPDGSINNLLNLHKRYDGKDKETEAAKFKEQESSKTKELNDLKNGHIMDPTNKTTFVFGITQLNIYTQNLQKAIDYVFSEQFKTKSIQAKEKKATRASRNKDQTSDNTDNADKITKDNITMIKDKINEGLFKNNGIVMTDGSINDQITTVNITNEYTVNISNNNWDIYPLTEDSDKFLNNLRQKLNQANAYLTILQGKEKQLDTEIKVIKSELTKLKQKPEELFVFKDEEEIPKTSISNLKKDNGSKITNIQDDILKRVINRYNRFKSITSSEVRSQYAEIDGSVDNIILEIKKLNELVKTSAITADQILNITEKIKNSFDKVNATNKIPISLKIGEKLSKIIKLSNQIKFLTQFQAMFFKESSTGIFVEYEKKLDPNDTFTKSVIQELNQEKYSNFKKIIEFIKEKFIKNNVVSLNSNLAKLLKEYFENQNNGFYDQVVEPANKLLNSGEQPNFNDLESLWNISVTSIKSTTGGTEFEIYVYMDVIEGEVNASNRSDIKCQYLDEQLTLRFESLTNGLNEIGPDFNNTKVFSVKKAKEEKTKHEEEKKKEIDSALNATIAKHENVLKVKGGKKYTKAFKSRPKNQNRTKKVLYK
jgi:hypothetical protein